MRSEVWSGCGASARARNPSDVLSDQELGSKTASDCPTENQQLGGVSQNADGKLTLFVEDLRRFQISGLYRHFDAQGRLLYVGETANFLNRTMDHLRYAEWRDKIFQN
jgi:hypothetical protein